MTRSDEHRDRQIDDLLLAWATEHVMDRDREVDLVQAIMIAGTQPQPAPKTDSQVWTAISESPPLMSNPRGKWLATLATAAVVLMVVVAISFERPGVSSRSSVPASQLATAAGLSDLWSRTSEVFGPQLNWLCDLDGELLLGVDDDTPAQSASERAFILLTIRRRDVAASNWKSVWTGRIVCGLGEAIDFESPSKQIHSDGTVWVQTRPDGRLVASHWLNWSAFPEVSGAVEADVAPGETRVIAQRVVDGQSIQLVQQICLSRAG